MNLFNNETISIGHLALKFDSDVSLISDIKLGVMKLRDLKKFNSRIETEETYFYRLRMAKKFNLPFCD